MGLIMVISDCFILYQLKFNVCNYLFFVIQDDFIICLMALYLLCQYFNYWEGKWLDWELQGLISFNVELQILNQVLWE